MLAVCLLGLNWPLAAAKSGEQGEKEPLVPGIGVGLIDGDGKPSLVLSLANLLHRPSGDRVITSRYALAFQRFETEYDGTAPSSDAAIFAASLRAFRYFPLTERWHLGAGIGLRHRLLTESWVSLSDEAIVASINRGDAYAHFGLSYSWQRESALIWLKLLGVQLRLAELYRTDNLDGLEVLDFWKNQLRTDFHGDADQRLRLALIGITFIPAD